VARERLVTSRRPPGMTSRARGPSRAHVHLRRKVGRQETKLLKGAPNVVAPFGNGRTW
jgi:hypothetical protein